MLHQMSVRIFLYSILMIAIAQETSCGSSAMSIGSGFHIVERPAFKLGELTFDCVETESILRDQEWSLGSSFDPEFTNERNCDMKHSLAIGELARQKLGDRPIVYSRDRLHSSVECCGAVT